MSYDPEYYRRYYLEHRKKYAHRDYMDQQAQTSPGVSHFQRWLPHEDEVVLRTDLTLVEIAHRLGRTYAAVRARRSILHHKQKEHQ